jgi:single-stranded DNA-binding protein
MEKTVKVDRRSVKVVGKIKSEPMSRLSVSGKKVTYLRIWSEKGWDEAGKLVLIETEGQLAETAAELFNKGQRVYVEGELKILRWQKGTGEFTSMIAIAPQILQVLK